MKKIAVGDLGEFWYGDYKEPFVHLEGAVPGYPEGVQLTDDDGKLLCAFCGKTFDHLGRHLGAHGLRAPEYKREVGLFRGSALVSERIRQPMVAAAVRHAKANSRNMKALSALATASRAQTIAKGMRFSMPAERANKTGQCAAQIRERAAALYRQHGHLTRTLLERHGIRAHRVNVFFGSYDGLVRMVTGQPLKRHRWANTELLSILKNLAHEIGHTPATSDARRYGIPPHSTYLNRFGSWAEACRQAGLQPNLPMPPTRDDEVAVLVAYATSGSLARTTASTGRGVRLVKRTLERYGIPLVTAGTNDHTRMMIRDQAAEIARRLASWPEQSAA